MCLKKKKKNHDNTSTPFCPDPHQSSTQLYHHRCLHAPKNSFALISLIRVILVLRSLIFFRTPPLPCLAAPPLPATSKLFELTRRFALQRTASLLYFFANSFASSFTLSPFRFRRIFRPRRKASRMREDCPCNSTSYSRKCHPGVS